MSVHRLVVLVALLLALGACGTDQPPTPAGSGPVDREIVVTISKKEVSPATARYEVASGTLVRITATSDVDDSLHVHGYDRSVTLRAGVPGSLDLRADRTGLFEVETHDTRLVLFQLVVR